MRSVLILAAALLAVAPLFAHQIEGHSPRLLLTPQRLKRLKRERTRQTDRWVNFENRVKTVPDSPERGFELALFYAVTGESDVELEHWAVSHPCQRRQVALISDELGRGVKAVPPSASACPPSQSGPLSKMRDFVFESLLAGDYTLDADRFLNLLRSSSLRNANEIYAAAEILEAIGSEQRASVRGKSSQYFNSLPVQFLLSLKPADVEHPDWMAHVTSLALVALDPNSDSAQFLQGWAIEDRQMLHDGPGLAYELLWADPYLPGVGYQNLDPWWYDETAGRLLARSDWSANACAIQITSKGLEETNCPAGWKSKKANFGRLELIPMTGECTDLVAHPNTLSAILWHLPPGGRLKVKEDGKSLILNADGAGLWRAPSNIIGKVCSAR